MINTRSPSARINTNPVIIRRSRGDLRRAGLVDVRPGAGAGWSLAREPAAITLLDVYDAVAQEPLFGMHRTEPNLACPAGRGIRPALGEVEQALRDVLLLRPVTARDGFPEPAAARPPVGHSTKPPALVLATIYHRADPVDAAFVDFFDREVRPVLAETGATPLACLQAEHAENTFPLLPVRISEHVFVWFARFPSQAGLDDHLHRLAHSDRWRHDVLPALSATFSKPAQRLRLAPLPPGHCCADHAGSRPVRPSTRSSVGADAGTSTAGP